MDSPISTRAALLQILLDEEGFGRELIERVRVRTSGRIRLGQGSVYPTLAALEEEGLVSAREEQMGGGRPRRYFRITLRGQKIAIAERAAIVGLLAVTP